MFRSSNEGIKSHQVLIGFLLLLQIHSVEHFVCSVNSHLTMRQENERLKGIMARIESYDVVVCTYFVTCALSFDCERAEPHTV